MSFIGQSIEAKIFVEIYGRLPDDKFALLIHDCILLTKKDVGLVKKRLENRVREIYPDVILHEQNLDKLFKASLVSITDDKLLRTYREEYYRNEFEEDGQT